jgi:uncharacterized protein (DUF1684 family)
MWSNAPRTRANGGFLLDFVRIFNPWKAGQTLVATSLMCLWRSG